MNNRSRMIIIALLMVLFYHYAQNPGETHPVSAKQNITKESSEKIPKETPEEVLGKESAESYQKVPQNVEPDWTVRPKSYDDAVVSDFLSMNTEEFAKKYDKKELYDRDILYCTREAWKYDGELVDAFQEESDCYKVEEITAIRFLNGYSADRDIWEERDTLADNQEAGNTDVRYFGDYAMSMYFRQNTEGEKGKEEQELIELSYIKVKLDESDSRETAPAILYDDIERYYYQVQEEIQSGEWAVSPDQQKAVCITNGMIPKHPAQIFVRYQDKHPDVIFRRTWECHFAEWVDEDHFICYNDGGPIMIHLETHQIEDIKKEEDDYDTWGCEYEIKGNQLIATFMDEEYYRWDIVREGGEIRMIKAEALKDINLPESLETVSVCEAYEKETDEEVVSALLDQVAAFLRTEEGFSDFKIMYDGNTSFLGRKYYDVALIEDNGITIHTLQRYHIDMETGNLYAENDHMITGERMELIYRGNIQIP